MRIVIDDENAVSQTLSRAGDCRPLLCKKCCYRRFDQISFQPLAHENSTRRPESSSARPALYKPIALPPTASLLSEQFDRA